MSFSEHATVFGHDADPAAIQAARDKGQDVVILPRFDYTSRGGNTLEVVVVERGMSWPNCCVTCGSQGPWLGDSQVDKPGIADKGSGFGRVYICKTCARTLAAAFGFAKGPRLDELQNAGMALEQRDKELGNRDKRIEKLTEAIAERDRRLKQQQLVIDGQAEKLSTAQHVAGIAAAANTQLAEVFFS